MSDDGLITARQLWGSVATSTASSNNTWCTPLILPTGGIIVFNENTTYTISGAKATFKLPCDSDQVIISPDTTGNSSVIGFSGPFYASISPQIFALATATVISYVLVILIFITPRTFYVGGPSGGGGGRGAYLSRGGLLPGSSNSVIGVGRRPLLQKIATIAAAASLTIASVDTFNVAESQYHQGFIDSTTLVDDVVDSLEIRIVQVISDTFLWLAQVQTLIRLFPRHREKVTIKWLGFAMVICDTVFSILDSFVSADDGRDKPRTTQDAIPALNYLFDLAIALIYASCVVYYSLSKRRFAFWHPKMRNICLVALISYLAIAIPVVFFILDVSLPDVAGWGEYIRWVGAAAASVVVWEWVERIEALERDERKDGILGREIFDGDEMLDLNSSEDRDSRRRGYGIGRRRGRGISVGGHVSNTDVEKGSSLAFRFTHGIAQVRAKLPLPSRRRAPPREVAAQASNGNHDSSGVGDPRSREIVIPHRSNAITPSSRSDSASAASTVYAVRYHNLSTPSPAIPEHIAEAHEQEQEQEQEHDHEQAPQVGHNEPTNSSSDHSTDSAAASKDRLPIVPTEAAAAAAVFVSPIVSNTRPFWLSAFSPFKRRRAEPPAEVAGAQIASGARNSPIDRAVNLRERIGSWGHIQLERLANSREVDVADLPVTVIPAPRADGRTWSPDEAGANNSGVNSTAPTVQEVQGEPQLSSQAVLSASSPHSEQPPGASGVTEHTPDPVPRPTVEESPAEPTRQPTSASEDVDHRESADGAGDGAGTEDRETSQDDDGRSTGGTATN